MTDEQLEFMGEELNEILDGNESAEEAQQEEQSSERTQGNDNSTHVNISNTVGSVFFAACFCANLFL